jgi:hypothetical protein
MFSAVANYFEALPLPYFFSMSRYFLLLFF